MRITLFIPCFVDLMFPKVGISMVQILERLGHTIECPEAIACCGQPAYNSGYWEEARTVATKTLDALASAEVVVIASGSCGAMLKVFYPELFAGTPQAEAAHQLARKCYEFSDFLVSRLGVTDVGARFPAKVTFHDGCHGLRELLRPAPSSTLPLVALCLEPPHSAQGRLRRPGSCRNPEPARRTSPGRNGSPLPPSDR